MKNKVEKGEELGEEIVLYQSDESITMVVRFDASQDAVWLNRLQMAELFDLDVKIIGKHINNALREELSVDSVDAKNATTQERTGNQTVANFAIVHKEDAGYGLLLSPLMKNRKKKQGSLRLRLPVDLPT